MIKSVSRIAAIAGLAVRAAVRSRLFICLIAVLVAVLALLPFVVEGDGTLAGTVKVLLFYSLGFTGAMLGTATLWSACGSISEEIEGKQIQLVAVKPVRRLEIWLGKWCGLLVMNAVLLAVAGAMIYGLLHWRIAAADAGAREREALQRQLWTARRRVNPKAEDLDAEVHQRVESLEATGRLPPGTSIDAVFSKVKERLLVEQNVVVPGQARRWSFPGAGEGEAAVRFRFSIPGTTRRYASGTWQVGTESRPALYEVAFSNALSGTHQIVLPADLSALDADIVLTLVNAGPDRSATMMVDVKQGVALLFDAGGFAGNFVRALLILFCQLALVSALGLAMSALFSFPVATFVAAALLAMSVLVHYGATEAGPVHVCSAHGHHDASESLFFTASEQAVKGLNVVIAPAVEQQPIGPLTDGILVSWGRVAAAAGLLLVLYPAVFGAVGARFFARRELALPYV